MPNGKGSLDCRYCVYGRPTDGKWPPLVGGALTCLFHQQELPDAKHSFRFCINFQTNDFWYSENYGGHEHFPMFMQIARFGAELETGVLYCYECGIPNTLEQVKRLRTPDFKNRTWREVEP